MLAKTAVTDDGVARLARMPLLENLSLGATAVSDRGVAAIAELPKLDVINLSETKVSDLGLNRLLRRGRLTRVWASNCQSLSPAAVAAFQQAAPDVLVVSQPTSSPP
jgi:hypothetical protein